MYKNVQLNDNNLHMLYFGGGLQRVLNNYMYIYFFLEFYEFCSQEKTRHLLSLVLRNVHTVVGTPVSGWLKKKNVHISTHDRVFALKQFLHSGALVFRTSLEGMKVAASALRKKKKNNNNNFISSLYEDYMLYYYLLVRTCVTCKSYTSTIKFDFFYRMKKNVKKMNTRNSYSGALSLLDPVLSVELYRSL